MKTSTIIHSPLIPTKNPSFKPNKQCRTKNSIITYVNLKPRNNFLPNSLLTTRVWSRPVLVRSSAGLADGGSMMMSSGAFGSLSSVTLDKPKPALDKSTRKSPFEEKFQFDDISGGGGGGNKIGGGDNGGGGVGDDDDYFDDFDDEDDGGDEGGWFRGRIALHELYDRKFIQSVLNEWQKTMKDLPEGIRVACELGAMSSAQLVKFLMNEARPTSTRAIYRSLSEPMSKAFIGRTISDPAFLHKLLFDQFITIACSIHSEIKRRGERIRQEWDLALINVLTVSACNLIVVWSLAPCWMFGNKSRFNFHKLPNNVFEAHYRHEQFDVYQRIQSFVYKAVEFSLIGFIAGAVQTTDLCARNKEGRLSVEIQPANTNALGYGAFLGLYTNWRYQMLNGMDKVLTSRFDVIGMSLFFAATFRILNAQLGEISRNAWLDTQNFSPLPRKKRLVRNKLHPITSK